MFRKPTPYEIALWAALPMAHTPRLEGRLRMILDNTRARRATTRRALLLALMPGAAALVALAVLRLDARAQAAPASARPPAALAPPSSIPQAPGTISRYFIGPGPRLMKQVGAITWSQPRLALLPRALPSGAKVRAETSLKHLRAAAPEVAPRIVQFPRPAAAPEILPAIPDRAVPPPAPPAPAAPTGDVSVDLVGVTDGAKWWDAAGTPLPQPLYSPTAYHTGKYDYWRKAFDAGKPRLDFAFRVSPASARDVTLRFSLESPDVPWSSTLGTWPEKMQGRDQQTETQLNSLSGGLRVLSATCNSAPTARPITVSVASGPWAVAATAHVSAAGPAQSFASHVYFFSQLFEADGKSRVIISTNDTENDVRVVAVDAQGRETLPAEIGDTSTPAMSQMTALFALPAAQIKELRVETRPFRQMTFKDIAARPAK